MTMPKFDPVAHMQVSVEEGVDTYFPRLHKPEKYNADWWRFDPLHSADQLTEAYEAGKREQTAELEAARAEIERLKHTPPSKREDLRCVISDLCHQVRERDSMLAAEQAKNVGLREALEYSIKQVPELATVPGISKALSTPSDTSALEALVAKAGEKMHEKCIMEFLSRTSWYAEKGMRALPAVTLEDLK